MVTRTAGIVAAGTQNRRVISVGCRMCYRTHRSVGYCGTTVTELTDVQGIVCRSLRVISVEYLICCRTHRSCRVLWCNCHITHRSIGYCGTAVTELTDVLCRVETEGNYPRYRSVGTLQYLSVESRFVFLKNLSRTSGKGFYRHQNARLLRAGWQEYARVRIPGIYQLCVMLFVYGEVRYQQCGHTKAGRT